MTQHTAQQLKGEHGAPDMDSRRLAGVVSISRRTERCHILMHMNYSDYSRAADQVSCEQSKSMTPETGQLSAMLFLRGSVFYRIEE